MSSQTKIVMLTDCLVDPDAGGAERNIYELAGRLDKKKFAVILASLDCEGTAPGEMVESTGCQLLVFRVRRIYGFSGIKQGIRFMKFLKDGKVDILQTYHFSSDIWGTFFAHWAGVKIIISNRRDMGFWRRPQHVWVYRLINRWVNKIIVVSEAVKKMVMATENVPEEKIELIYNGVDLIPSPSVPRTPYPVLSTKKECGIKDDERVIMHVANFKKVKGHRYLLQAFSSIVKDFSNTRLVLIGEDEFNGAMQNLADELDIKDKVIFLGKRNDVRHLLAFADICVLPSLSEGMSNAILEYMAAGKPVVATRVGGNQEIVQNGVTGLLVAAQDAGDLAEAVCRLLKDATLRSYMGEAGSKRVEEKFNIRNMVLKYQDLYENLMTPTSPP